MGTFRTSSPGSISSNPERTALRRRWGELGYIEVWQQRADSWYIKRWLLIKKKKTKQKTRYLQVKDFSAFLCMGKCRSLGLHPDSLRAHHQEWLQSYDCYTAGILFLLSFLRPHWLTFRGCRAAIADDCDILCLLIWQETFRFSPPRLIWVLSKHVKPLFWAVQILNEFSNVPEHLLWER